MARHRLIAEPLPVLPTILLAFCLALLPVSHARADDCADLKEKLERYEHEKDAREEALNRLRVERDLLVLNPAVRLRMAAGELRTLPAFEALELCVTGEAVAFYPAGAFVFVDCSGLVPLIGETYRARQEASHNVQQAENYLLDLESRIFLVERALLDDCPDWLGPGPSGSWAGDGVWRGEWENNLSDRGVSTVTVMHDSATDVVRIKIESRTTNTTERRPVPWSGVTEISGALEGNTVVATNSDLPYYTGTFTLLTDGSAEFKAEIKDAATDVDGGLMTVVATHTLSPERTESR